MEARSNTVSWSAMRSFARILGAILLFGLSKPVQSAKMTAADYFVSSLPGAPEPLLKMHAGHIEVNPDHHGNLFFWHFQNRHIANKQRTVLWLNGGPGCSSLDGAMMEIGPYRVNKDMKLEMNDGSWDEFANVLFVDQPVGTGFSYVDTDSYIHELPDMAAQMVVFLEEFFTLFPEYRNDDLYIAGESYAGQYIPYVARAILDRNAQKTDKWNLQGLLIGNGWISGPEQYRAYLDYAYKEEIIVKGSVDARKVEAQQAVCMNDLEAGGKDHVSTSSCELILTDILRLSRFNEKWSGQCLNMYDIRLSDKWPSCGMAWPADLEFVKPYLRQVEVTRALHINPDKHTGWMECNDQVSGAFSARNSTPSRELLPGLLEQLPIILFSGDRDLICNHLGTEALINNLKWNGGTGMETSPGVWAPKRDWTFEGEPAGVYQTARNLTYIKFFNSSHMVPLDYPRRTRDMLDRFMEVDIASIGGTPADSRIDGEKGLETSVGGHPNSTAAKEAEDQALKEATWRAYYKSGEVALIVVIIAVSVWGYFLWRARRKHAGYKGLFGGDPADGPNGNGGIGLGIDSFRKGNRRQDVEAADFDEAELDDLSANRNGPEREHFDVGADSDEDEAYTDRPANGSKGHQAG